MLKIKLIRFGKKNQQEYRIVVQEARTKRDGQYAALLGHYAPTQSPKVLQLNLDLYKEWVTKGAQPTATVSSLAKRYETGNPFPPKAPKPSKKQLAKQEAEAAATAEAAAAETTAEATTTAQATEVDSSETTTDQVPATADTTEPAAN